MKAVIHSDHSEHQRQHAEWMAAGMRAHGVTVEAAGFDCPTDADVVVVWGWRQHRVILAAKQAGRPILVMERGHIQPRMEWTSCGWGGLQNHAVYPFVDDGGFRFMANFGAQFQPATPGNAYVLVCGQVDGDASIGSLDIKSWAQAVTDDLARRGHWVTYRPHPLSVKQGENWCPNGARFSAARLAADLAMAKACVVYNSTAGVEAALAGVPVVALDKGSMAWPIASHSVTAPFRTPTQKERVAWAARLAWTQWTPAEILSGEAWAVIASAMPTE